MFSVYSFHFALRKRGGPADFSRSLLPYLNEMAYSWDNSSNQSAVSMFSGNIYFSVSTSYPWHFFFFLQILWYWVTEAPVSGSICADKIATHWGFFFSQKPDTWGRTASPGNSPRAGTGFSWPASLLPQDIPRGMFPKVESPRIPLHRLRLMLAGSTSHVFFSNIWIKNQKF